MCLTRLLGHAGKALGVATVDDLAGYPRIPTPVTARLLPATCLVPVRATAWADPDALTGTLPPHREPVFLGPFDNLIWYRPRTLRLFGFTQVFEAYKPAARRRHGYYVNASTAPSPTNGPTYGPTPPTPSARQPWQTSSTPTTTTAATPHSEASHPSAE